MKERSLVPRPQYFAAVNRFRATWSETKRSFVSDTSPKTFNRENWEKAVQELHRQGGALEIKKPTVESSYRKMLQLYENWF